MFLFIDGFRWKKIIRIYIRRGPSRRGVARREDEKNPPSVYKYRNRFLLKLKRR